MALVQRTFRDSVWASLMDVCVCVCGCYLEMLVESWLHNISAYSLGRYLWTDAEWWWFMDSCYISLLRFATQTTSVKCFAQRSCKWCLNTKKNVNLHKTACKITRSIVLCNSFEKKNTIHVAPNIEPVDFQLVYKKFRRALFCAFPFCTLHSHTHTHKVFHIFLSRAFY